jgi:hypothetical protein
MFLGKDDDNDDVRDAMRACGFTVYMHSRGEADRVIAHEASSVCARWAVSSRQPWIHRFRRLLIRWEQKPEHSLAFSTSRVA